MPMRCATSSSSSSRRPRRSTCSPASPTISRRLTERLAEYPQASLYFGFAEAANAGDLTAPFDHSPLMGRSNPLAPPITFEHHEDSVVGHVVFGSAYEGPPGCVHGGYVAAALRRAARADPVAVGQARDDRPAHVHYRKPTPLHTELRLVGRIVSIEGRKILTRGELYAGDVLTSEAEGLFISIDFSKFEHLLAAREQRASEPTTDS